MNKGLIMVLISTFTLLGCGSKNSTQSLPKETVTISKSVLADKIKGGWAGKTIGCTYGGPVEFLYNGTMIQDYVPIKYDDTRVEWYYDNFPGLYDDVYVNITFMEVFEKYGLEAPADSFAVAFSKAGYPLWHANQAALYNIKQGLMPPASGHWLNNPHADDIDYQIEADFAGLMSPGMPNSASDISDRVGHIITYGDGWYGGVYVGALYSMAFISDDINVVVEEALKTIPEQSDFYQCVNDVIKWHKEFPDDWKRTWFECEKKWSSEVGCPDGVFTPFDIDAKINSAYVTIGLLYGKADFFSTMDIAARCGQDADCNAATAAGILGTMIGYSKIPEQWRSSLTNIEDRPFAYTDVSLNKLYDLGLKHALQMIEKGNGKIDGDQVTIKCQVPSPVKYEKSFDGHYPVDKKSIAKDITQDIEFEFDGIGVVFKGYTKSEKPDYVARVEMYIDGQLVETANLPVGSSTSIDARRVDLFWKYQLPKGMHKATFKWLNPESKAQVYFGDALIYSDSPSTKISK